MSIYENISRPGPKIFLDPECFCNYMLVGLSLPAIEGLILTLAFHETLLKILFWSIFSAPIRDTL